MELRAGVVGAGQAAAAERDGRHVEVAPVLLHQQVGGGLGDAEQRVRRAVDRHRGRDAVVVLVVARELEALLVLLERQAVRRVAVDLVGRAEDERGVDRVLARRLEQVERAVGVDAEVGLRLLGGPVVRGLGGGVHDQLDLAGVLGEDALDAVGVADVDLLVHELVREPLLEHLGHAARRRLGAEEARAHVVLEADDGVAALGEVEDGLGADQAAGSGDDGDGHTRRLTRMADARTKRLTLIACILGTAVVFLDGTVVNVALPAIRDDLDTGLAGAAVGRRGLPADARLAAARRRLARRPARAGSKIFSVGLVGLRR